MLLVTCICISTYHFEALSSLLIYDRVAILEKEVWRLFTGLFVHFSGTHLSSNIMAFILLSMIIKETRIKRMLFLSIFFIQGILLFIFEQEMRYYAGLSAINYAFIVYVGLSFAYTSTLARSIGYILLTMLSIKVIMGLNHYLLPMYNLNKEDFRVSELSHIIGMMMAYIMYIKEMYYER